MAVHRGGALGAYTIDQDQFNQLVSFTRNDTFEASRDRVSEFFRADKTQEIMLHLAIVGGGTTVGFTIGGAVTGGLISGTPIGAAIGGATGLGIGLLVTGIYTGVKVSPLYDDWKRSVEDKAILNQFKEAYTEHPILNQFVCSITQEIIRDPVQIPCGHTFEKLGIKTWHDQNISKDVIPTCPDCRTPFTETQFSVDVTMMGKIKKTYGDIIRNEMTNPVYAPGVIEGFKVLEASMNEQVKEVLKDVSTKLTLQLTAGEITPQAFTRKIREVSELYPDEVGGEPSLT